jgi:hypothetical protein
VKCKISLLTIALLFLLAACSPDQSVPSSEVAAPSVMAQAAVELPATLTLVSTEAPSPTQAPATPVPPTDQPTSKPTEKPTTTPEPTTSDPPLVTRHSPLVTSGQTADGAFFLGAPDAPLTVIDYSDFL